MDLTVLMYCASVGCESQTMHRDGEVLRPAAKMAFDMTAV